MWTHLNTTTGFKTYRSYDAILQRLYDSRVVNIGCDVETPSLTDRTPLGAGFAISPTESFYFNVDDSQFPWSLLANPSKRIVFHNGGFDVRILEDYSNQPVTNFVDSCLAAQILGYPAKLADLCLALFGRKPRPITNLIGTGTTAITMRQVPFSQVALRGSLDAQDCLEAWEFLEGAIPKEALEVDNKFLSVSIKMERRGMRVDKKAVEKHFNRLNNKMLSIKLKCQGKYGFNPGSSLQLAAALKSRGLQVLAKRSPNDRKIRPALGKGNLETYYKGFEEADLTREYRSTQTLLTHLIKPLYEGKYMTGDYIFPRMNLNVARSGRVSRSVPAVQNLKEELRDIIIPSPGNVIYDWDFSQIELRWAAYYWEDKLMSEIFASGRDVHTATADQLIIVGIGHLLGKTAAERRRTAKDINFLMLYGGDEETMWNRKRIPHEIGYKLKMAYFEKFKGIANGIETTRQFALANGYTQTVLGRRRREDNALASGIDWKVAGACRELVNHVIQGSACETLKIAMTQTADEPMFHTVHDEVLLDVPPDYEFDFTRFSPAPFNTPVSIGRGPNWKEAAH